MFVRRFVSFSLVAAVLVGCGTTPVLQQAPPAIAQGQHYGIGPSATVARTDQTLRHLDTDQTVVYTQNMGGGGAALGVLLGPIGIAANMKMIESQTASEADKLKGKVVLNPKAALLQAAATSGFALQPVAGAADIKLSPFVLISKTTETATHISSAMMIEGTNGAQPWRRLYRYQLPGAYTLDQLSTIDGVKKAGLQADVVNGYVALLAHIAAETEASIAAERKITVKSSQLTPRFEFEMIGSLVREDAGLVWVRTTAGVYALAPSDVQIKYL